MVVGSSLSGFRRWPRHLRAGPPVLPVSSGCLDTAQVDDHPSDCWLASACQSDSTILRAVKERAAAQSSRAAARVIGIDEWAWRKGMNYGTIFVDLERRRVADLLADRTTATTADWFKLHPETEIVSRDRAGMYADAARQGAPQARQVADRFHLLKNLRRGHRAAAWRLRGGNPGGTA